MMLSQEEMTWLIKLPEVQPFLALRLCILFLFVSLNLMHDFNCCRAIHLQLRKTCLRSCYQLHLDSLWHSLDVCLVAFHYFILPCVSYHTLVQTTKRVKIAAIQWDWFTPNFSGEASSFAVPLPCAWPIVLASIKNSPHSTSQILEIFVNLQEKNNPNAWIFQPRIYACDHWHILWITEI